MSTQSKRTRRPKGKKPRRNAKRTSYPQMQGRSIARSMPLIAPDEMDAPLRFRKFDRLEDGVTAFGYVRFNPNAAYDVDPVLGSTETYGFDEYAALYDYYRVISYSYVVTFTNTGDGDFAGLAQMVYVLNTNTDPAVSGSRFDLYSTNPYCQSHLLDPFAGGKISHTFRKKIHISKLAGTTNVETADSWRSLVTGKPADLAWLTLGVELLGANKRAVAYDMQLVMDVRFFSRKVDLSLGGFEKSIKELKEARARSDFAKKIAPQPTIVPLVRRGVGNCGGFPPASS